MAEFTIEISDDLAQQLAPFKNQLSELFARLITTTLPALSSSRLDLHTTEIPPAYIEVLDFLVTRPTSKQILTFKVSEQSQVRLQILLQKNREGSINTSEISELNIYEQLDELMTLLKVRAYAANKNNSSSSHLA